jgi:CDP-6-deoxy-D-xylo-4-hexulose-3-dehydrase
MIVPASGAVLGDAEKAAMHAAVDKGWLTAGPITAEFERRLAEFTGIKYVHTVNSGSSANLVAVATMVEAGIWKAGDEIITVAASFPTTINPLLLYGLVPVFVDIELGTYNALPETVAAAVTDKTRGVMMAHTLGNPFRLPDLGLPVIEDCCDALGATVDGEHVGTHAHMATCSFFPAHHITTGEGGAVFTNDTRLALIAESIRDWGRDCWCEPGKENTCGKRFAWEWEALPQGYDHKYTYSRLGFNLKLTEIQAACGVAQIDRLPEFVACRRRNFGILEKLFTRSHATITLPNFSTGASPFGYPTTLKETGIRSQMQQYLSQQGIGSRLLFAGNITRQPYMNGRTYRVHGELTNTDKVLEDCFWIGCHPALTEEQLEYAARHVATFLGDFV